MNPSLPDSEVGGVAPGGGQYRIRDGWLNNIFSPRIGGICWLNSFREEESVGDGKPIRQFDVAVVAE